MISATWLAKDFHVRQRSLLSKGRAARLQGCDLKPFDQIYSSRFGSRRTVARVVLTPDDEYDMQIVLVPRGMKPVESDVLGADFEDWFTVCRRRTKTALWRVGFGAPRWESA